MPNLGPSLAPSLAPLLEADLALRRPAQLAAVFTSPTFRLTGPQSWADLAQEEDVCAMGAASHAARVVQPVVGSYFLAPPVLQERGGRAVAAWCSAQIATGRANTIIGSLFIVQDYLCAGPCSSAAPVSSLLQTVPPFSRSHEHTPADRACNFRPRL